jgi:hypothetical protein
LVGELAALLRLSGDKNAASLAGAADSGLLVAGTRNHLYRTVWLVSDEVRIGVTTGFAGK